MYSFYLVCLIFVTVFVLPVLANKSITSGDGKTSPSNTARVYQGATNLLPPDDETPPAQPTTPAEPETNTTSWLLGVVKELLPGTSSSLGAANLVGTQPEMSGLGKWLFGDSSKDCKSKSKDDSSKRSKKK